MSGQFNVDVAEVRTHARTVGSLSGQVGSSGTAQTPDSGAFGTIAQFFASAITQAGEQVRQDIGTAARAVADVQAGLTAAAEQYQRVDDEQARLFQGGNPDAALVQAQHTTQAVPYPTGQRAKAIEVLERISREHPVSVAAVALGPVRTLYNTAGNVVAATIGDHYERDVPHILALPPTDANLRNLADTETRYWQSDRGNLAGAAMPAFVRYQLLLGSRSDWLDAMSPADRARISAELGIRP